MEEGLAFIDLLGFSDMVTRYFQKARKILNDFYNISFDVLKNCPCIKGFLFSDSLVARSKNKVLLLNRICEIYRQCLMKNCEYDERNIFFCYQEEGFQ